jgi:vacuolar iron transporter family protein
VPPALHIEKHFLSSALVRDIVIGMADGLTVPFALAAGLSGAVPSTAIIVTAGLAEIAAGAIAMGLGGYLAARTDAEHYESELQREIDEIAQVPETERSEVRHILREHGLAPHLAETLTTAITSDHQRWLDFMMRFELGLEKPEAGREFRSAMTISCAYIAGGLLPLMPYVLFDSVSGALPVSAALTMATLLVFGGVKGRFTGLAPFRSALQTAIVGTLAAAAAFAIARLVSS